MAQASVTSYFATRKRRASEELRNKSKVLLLDDDERTKAFPVIMENQTSKIDQIRSKVRGETKKDMVARNLQFDLSSKSLKPALKSRASRTRKTSVNDDSRQPDIRETLLKVNKEIEEDKKAIFEKLGCLSPKKSAKRRVTRTNSKTIDSPIQKNVDETEYYKMPTKSLPAKRIKDMNLDEVKSRITSSSRIAELRAKIAKFKNYDDKATAKLQKLEQQLKEKKVEMKKNEDTVKIKEFEHIQLKIPVSQIQAQLSPNKFMSPTKTIQLSTKLSSGHHLLFEPKEVPANPVKSSPSKASAYQRFQSLVETEGKALPLPYHYRFLAEIFRSIDTVSAMLYNRKEIITFSKLKPAVQELVRRNFTLDHLAQIKTLYPEAFIFKQEKLRKYGSKQPEKYELVITPNIIKDTHKSGRNTPDEENVLKSARETHMSPSVLLERKRKLYNTLLEIVKDEHGKFLDSLDPPMKIPKKNITRWHPEFDTESCKDIEKAELPQPPAPEKLATAKHVLEKAHTMFNDNLRIKKAIEMLANNQTKINNETITATSDASEKIRNVEISIVETPPATPKVEKLITNPLFKGVPTSLLEKIRAKQAAKAMELMTRPVNANKDAVRCSRLPVLAKIIRNIFVTEKKSVLPLDFVIRKLDDSYSTKLTTSELEEHIRLICKSLPAWATMPVVRKVDYLKLAKDFDMNEVVKKLEDLADEKLR